MKLVLFKSATGAGILPGLLTERGVVDISAAVKKSYTPQLTMQGIIDDFERLRPALEKLGGEGAAVPLESVRLSSPLPRPGKILACIANYWEHAQREPRPLNMFMKNPDAVIGPGDTIMLPEFTVPWIFMHEAELAVVIKGPAKMVKAKNWRSAVFGYTAMIDVSRVSRVAVPGRQLRSPAGSASRSTPSRRSAPASPPPTRLWSRTT